MREDIKNRLTGAVRQFRHNSDNSPDAHNPREGFVFGYDREEVDELVGDLLGELEAARAQQSGEGREPFACHCVKGGQDCFSRTLREGDAAMWEMSGAVVTPLYKEESFVRPTCKGANCFAVDGVGHSPECKAEHEAAYTHPPKAQGVPEGWKFERESGDRITIDADGLGFYVARMDAERIADIMLYALAQDLLSTIPPSDKPEGEWVKCSERLPTEDDADALRQIWIYSDVLGVLPLSKDSFSEPPFYTHWMPTGLTRPAAPDMGGEK